MQVTLQQRQIFRELLNCDNVHIITHKSPDGDTLASAAALKHLYELRGKKAEILCSDPVAKRVRFIVDGAEELSPSFSADFTVCVDVATDELIGEKISSLLTGKVDFCIDHHFSNTEYAAETILDGKASSTGEVLYALIKDAGIKLDGFLAEKLYTAISFDTGCFKYSNVTPYTHMAAAELISFDFDSAEINARLFDYASFAQLRLEAAAVNRIKLFSEGKIAVLTVTKAMIEESGLDEKDAEGLTNLTRRVESAVVSATLKQTDEGYIKVSLRSNDNFNVASVASRFGGGGHLRAAGCVLRCSSEEAEKRVSEVLVEEWEKYNDSHS